MNAQSLLTAPNAQYNTRPDDERFETFDALEAAVNARTATARERAVPFEALGFKTLEWGADKLPVLNGATEPARFTHWSFGQVCSRVGAPAAYLRTLPPALAAENLRVSAARAEDKGESVKLLVGEEDAELDGPTGGRVVRAVTATSYGRVWDRDVLAAVRRLLETTGGRFQNPPVWEKDASGAHKRGGLYASDRDVFAFFIDGGSIVEEKGPREGALFRGFYVSNSETGSATLRLVSFLFRQVCGNHTIVGGRDVVSLAVRHSSGAPGRFLSEVAPAILDYAQSSAKGEEETIRKAQAYALPAVVEERERLFLGRGFTRGEVRGAQVLAEKEEGGFENLWQALNGFTAKARELAHIDARADLERRAGKLLELVG